jgi:hypothetical protein
LLDERDKTKKEAKRKPESSTKNRQQSIQERKKVPRISVLPYCEEDEDEQLVMKLQSSPGHASLLDQIAPARKAPGKGLLFLA